MSTELLHVKKIPELNMFENNKCLNSINPKSPLYHMQRNKPSKNTNVTELSAINSNMLEDTSQIHLDIEKLNIEKHTNSDYKSK